MVTKSSVKKVKYFENEAFLRKIFYKNVVGIFKKIYTDLNSI